MTHPVIVSTEVFELVQMEIESRRQFGSRYSGRGVFASRVICADCGGFYGSKVWHSNCPYRTVIWRCNRKYEKGKRCTTPHVKEEAIKAGFVQVMARLLASKQDVLEGCRQVLDEVLTTDEQARQIAKLQDQAVGLAQRIRGLVNEKARTQMAKDEFTSEFDRRSVGTRIWGRRQRRSNGRRRTRNTGQSGNRCSYALHAEFPDYGSAENLATTAEKLFGSASE